MSGGIFARRWLSVLALCLGLRADQIVMKNGDRVTGGIVKKDAKTLTIKTEHFGVVTLPWEQVTSVTADKPLHVTLTGGQTVQGSLATTGDWFAVAGAQHSMAQQYFTHAVGPTVPEVPNTTNSGLAKPRSAAPT